MRKYQDYNSFEAEVKDSKGRVTVLRALCMNETRAKRFKKLNDDKRDPEKKSLDFMVLCFGHSKMFYKRFSRRLLGDIFMDYCKEISNPQPAQTQPA
jgi:hypothetical protein